MHEKKIRKKEEKADCHYLDTDTSLELELQSDHVHLFHRAKLIELRNFLRHLINRHLNRVQLCAGLADDLNTLLHVGEQVAGCSKARNGQRNSPTKRAFKKAHC